MLKKVVFILVSLIATLQQAHANIETVLPETYMAKSMYFQVGFGGTKLVQNGVEHDAGIFFGDIKELIESPPESVKLIDSGNTKMKVGFSVGIGSFIAGMLAAPATGGISALAGLGIYLWGIVYSLDGVNNVHKAIWIHNGYVINH